jgi:hypothetical protein
MRNLSSDAAARHTAAHQRTLLQRHTSRLLSPLQTCCSHGGALSAAPLCPSGRSRCTESDPGVLHTTCLLGVPSAECWRAVLLQVRLMEERGYHIGNLDATIIAQKPKLSPHKVGIRHSAAHPLPSGRTLGARMHACIQLTLWQVQPPAGERAARSGM